MVGGFLSGGLGRRRAPRARSPRQPLEEATPLPAHAADRLHDVRLIGGGGCLQRRVEQLSDCSLDCRSRLVEDPCFCLPGRRPELGAPERSQAEVRACCDPPEKLSRPGPLGRQMRPMRRAFATASTRERAPRLRSTPLTWLRTVSVAMLICSAICAVE